MKKFVYWLMGERAGRITVSAWNWLWGIPVESGGQVAVEVAEKSLYAMQASVQQLAEAVAIQVEAYKRARQKYQDKVKEFRRAEQQAATAKQAGNLTAARLAMARALQTERILPPLKEQFERAAQVVKASQERLDRERMKLETYKTDLQNMKDMTEINAALAAIAEVNNNPSNDSARSQFDSAKEAVEWRHLQEVSYAELSEDPTEKKYADLENMALDEEIERRLQSLEGSGPKPKPKQRKPSE